MKIRGAVAILTLFLAAVVLAGCVGRDGNSNGANISASNASATGDAARTNVEELALLVKVPYESEDIVWKEDAAKKRVIAVLRFSPADANQIVADAEKAGSATKVSLPAESWFPGELIAQSEMSGDGKLNGTAYPANGFFQAPYSNGMITRIEDTDYFVLDVTAN